LHGTDVECGNVTYKSLAKAVQDGKLSEKDLDGSLRRLFAIRFRLGMFDPVGMVKYAQIPITALESQPHKEHALKMARESIVLLRNQNHLLPLRKNIRKIAVLGPNADNASTQLGNYNGQPSVVTTVLQGIKNKLGSAAEVFYSRATDFVDTTQPGFAKLIDSVKDADILIYVGGISPRLEGEEMRVNQPGFNGGDRTTIQLPTVQTDFLKALSATGKQVIFVMMTGSALAIPWEADNIPAIINAWYGGQAAGTAVADVLFGDYNPSGRLPVTFYRSDRDLPSFEDYSMANRTYRYFKGEPLYPFGFGLSYSSFKYSSLTLSKQSVKKNESLHAEVTVTNMGTYTGDEVVQLYIAHEGINYAPFSALKNFKRVTLRPGASQKVSFDISPEMLKLVDAKGATVFQPGNVRLIIGGSAPGARSAQLGAARPAEIIVTLK